MSNPSTSLGFDTFGELLRHLRRRARLTQRDLSQAVGYSDAHITRLENGQRLPDLTVVKGLFVEALDLKHDPELARRLIELATKARGDVSLVEREREASARARTNLPAQLTSFIGREQEITEVKELLRTARLLTLIGAGGVGKTRLALEAAAGLLDANAFADGVWLVELAALTDSTRVPQTVAATLKLIEQPGHAPLDTVADYFKSKHTLLILDNCEHLITACADLAMRLLQRCPWLRILATSRETLRIPGEVVYRVPSLSFPDPQRLPPIENLLEYEAVHLFVARTRGMMPDFTVTAQNARPLAQVCHRLDCIPLAIELAAARVSVMPVEQIAARLDDRFHLLTGGSRTALSRHQTLRATIDWSYELLSGPERALLRRLSVFSGGWTLDAAEAVCAGTEVERAHVLDLLTHLTDKSLLIADYHDQDGQEHQGAETRFGMLEMVREYAREKGNLQRFGNWSPNTLTCAWPSGRAWNRMLPLRALELLRTAIRRKRSERSMLYARWTDCA